MRRFTRCPEALVFGLVLLAIWLPRGLALDRFATPDEAAWVGRSAAFYAALVHRDYASTFQHGHPGVTLTWAGTLAYRLRYPAMAWEATPRVLKNWQNVEPFLRGKGIPPLDILRAARILMVLGNTLALGLAFLAARRSMGLWPATFGFALIALDPFDIGLTRLLHLDGLMSSLMLLSLLAFGYFLWGRGHPLRSWRLVFLILSALAAGLSWLTRSPALFLAPFLGLLVSVELLRDGRTGRRPRWTEVGFSIWPLLLWLGVAALIFALLWPSMWVAPLETLGRVFGRGLSYAAEGHSSDIFFDGRIVAGDPGWAFYPISFFWRTTPFVLIGLGLGAMAFVKRWDGFDQPGVRRITIALLLFALLYGVFVSLSAKKFDRYLLPVYLPLDLLAGMGWLAALRRLVALIGDRSRFGRSLAPLLLLVIILGQAGLSLQTYPYYLSYYNPLLGGSVRAPQVMMIGWGEGLDQAARYLNTHPDAEHLRVMSHYAHGSFSYFFAGETMDIPARWEGPDAESLRGVDYLVLYVHQWQRQQPDPAMLTYFTGQSPELIVRINGIQYAQVYRLHP